MAQPTLKVIDGDNVPQTIYTANPNGQATSANSAPVVIANDQSALPVTGPVTNTELRATAVPVSGPLTDTQLRATPVAISNPLAAPITGQVVITVTGTSVALPSNALLNGVVVKSKSTNNVAGGFVGGATVTTTDDGSGNGFKLAPGEGISIGVSNTNSVYVNGTAGDIFYFAGN